MTYASTVCRVAALLLVTGFSGVQAQDRYATARQAQQVADFYADNPGVLPVMAARRLKLPELIVASGLDKTWAASAPGSAFDEVWNALAGLEHRSQPTVCPAA